MNTYEHDLLKNRIPVFPLGKHSKEPLPGSKGFKDATTDEKIISSWDAENFGIPTGDISAIFVFDCDIKTGVDGLSGFLKILKLNSLDEYIKKYSDALIIKTGSGGYHFYYGIPVGLDHNLRNTININSIQGLDVRGNGGYVVSPGSIHPNGNKYEIIHGSLSNIPLMPEELYRFWYSHDHPNLAEDDFNEPKTPVNLNDDRLSLLVKTGAMIFKKPPVNEGHELLMAFSGAMALRDIDIEKTKLILKDAANFNHWTGKINFATVQDSYNRVKLQKSGKIKEEEKFKTFVKGYTTLKRIIRENKENYENFDEIIKNLELIFEHHQSPFYDIDGHNVKHFNKGKSINFVISKYTNLYTDELENLYHFSDLDGWHDNVENEIKAFIQITDDSISEHNITEIISGIKHLTYNKEFKNNKLPNTLIPIPSGLFNIETKKLEPHNFNYFYENITRNYMPGVRQESLVLDDFLSKTLVNPDKDKNTVYEAISWAFLNDNNIQGLIIFYGEGGNGKGIIQNQVIANLLGRENVAMPDLNRIANYAFELQSLINKRALLLSESVKGVTYNWEILKRITGHDFENIPIKNKPSILSRYQSAVILSTNSLIPPKDEFAIWRRIINIVEFNNYLNSLDSSEITKIVEQLSDPSELDTLFSFIIDEIYPEFLKHGFTHRYNIKTAKERYLMKSNPAIAYLKLKEARDEILTDPDDVINYCKNHGLDQNNCISTNRDGTITVFEIKSALIKQVNQFCKVNHLPTYDEEDRNSQIKMGQAIHFLDLEVSEFRKRINGKPIHAWSGIFVTPDDEYLKIDDNDGSNPENPDPSKNPEGQGTLDTGKDNDNNGKQEPETDDEKKEEKPGDEDTGDNPPDNSPDPNKSGQNEANKKEENNEHKSEKTLRIPKNPKMYCYKIMDHFDAYPDSYFDGSDIIMVSYKPIYHKNSSNIFYILLKVLIPEDLSQQPVNWTRFLADSQEISSKQFEVLSRGDAE